jgi:hypothetical protein
VAARHVSGGYGSPVGLPSPNSPTNETAVVCPGTVLFEGVNVSEGRGTPGHSSSWARRGWRPSADGMHRLELAGVRFRPALFEPTFTNTRRSAGAAVRFTSSTARASGRSRRSRVACAFRTAILVSSHSARRPYKSEHRSCRSTPRRIVAAQRADRSRHARPRDRSIVGACDDRVRRDP